MIRIFGTSFSIFARIVTQYLAQFLLAVVTQGKNRAERICLAMKGKAELILKTLKSVGVTEEMEFDSYEEAICWYD